MDTDSPLLSSFVQKDHIKCIEKLDIRDKEEKKKSLKSAYIFHLKKRWFSAFVLTIFTAGVYPFKLYKKCERDINSAIAARKIYYFDQLLEKIEAIRKELKFVDPKSAIYYVYKNLLIDDELALKKIYSKSDLLLSITTPVEKSQYDTAVKDIRKTKDFYSFWRKIKQGSRHQEITYIKNINTHYSLLKNRYLLPKEEIHVRLTRTIQGVDPTKLSVLKSLSDAFQEITTAFESLVSLKKNDFESFELLSSLLNLSSQDAQEIYNVLTNKAKLSSLSSEMLKYLLSLIVKKDVIVGIYDNSSISHIFLTLNELQLKVLSELHDQLINSETFTSRLMKCFYEKLKPCDDFTSKLCPDDSSLSQVTFKGKDDEVTPDVTMTKGFLDEMNTKWESIDVAHDENTYSFDAEPSISFEHLNRVHKTLADIAGEDKELLFLLQEALSKKGKRIISESLKNSIKDILGEEMLCADLNLSNIKIHKLNPEYLEIEYYFDKPGIPGNSFSPSIIQPLKKDEGHWKSD
ncbi:MAG: hypothetical protein S4CHLAM37_06780 [Chlamydiia bacterium]|nr:hypothetical protein [Chlamydiia bacterium]